MGGSASENKSNGRAIKLMSEVRIWSGALLMMSSLIIGSTAWGVYRGNDLVSAVASPTGMALGVLLSWGVYHLVCRRFSDLIILSFVAGIVGTSAIQRPPFLVGFCLTLLSTAFTLSILWALGFSSLLDGDAQRSKKAAHPQSDHLLYDAEVDATVGPGSMNQMGMR